jgi:hypothetical protein
MPHQFLKPTFPIRFTYLTLTTCNPHTSRLATSLFPSHKTRFCSLHTIRLMTCSRRTQKRTVRMRSGLFAAVVRQGWRRSRLSSLLQSCRVPSRPVRKHPTTPHTLRAARNALGKCAHAQLTHRTAARLARSQPNCCVIPTPPPR